MSTEQNSVQLVRKGDSTQGIMAEVIDKMESKVLNMEQTLEGVRGQVHKEQENVGRMELLNLRNNQDFKSAVSSLQVDFG